MKDSIRISASFSFKGVTHQPSMIMELDTLAEKQQPEDLYPLLANQNGIGLYSYEYEMLQAESLVFDQPQGQAAAFVKDGKLDWQALHTNWKRTRLLETLGPLARQHMNIERLSDVPGLEETLLAAYRMGTEQAQ